MINRGSVIVRPRKPYIDWADQLDDSEILPSAEGEKTVYLIPEYESDAEAMEVLEQAYAIIFENELYGWHTHEPDWPQNRSFSMFLDWFSIEFHSIVEDLCDYSITDED